MSNRHLHAAQQRLRKELEGPDFPCFPLLCSGCCAAPASGDSARFVGHPLANEIGTRDQVEHATLSTHQVKQRGTVHFFKVLEIEQYPQLACARSLNKLIQIRKMTLK